MRIATGSLMLALVVLVAPSAYPNRDYIEAKFYVQSWFCDYDSHVWDKCLLGAGGSGGPGYAYLELYHRVWMDNFGQVYWNDMWTVDWLLEDEFMFPGWPRQCGYTDVNWFIEDPDTGTIYVDTGGNACACLDYCGLGACPDFVDGLVVARRRNGPPARV